MIIMEKLNKEENTKEKNSWLQRLKDESWEAELLVSAIAIFGTFQLFGLIDWWTNKFIDILDPSQYLIGYSIIFFGLIAISILVAMFIIHFILRAYWIGLVGLNSVFPDYSIEDSAYSKIYTEKIVAILPKLKESIKSVDELCSVIFSAAFTFLSIYAYLGLFASFYLLLYNLLSDYVPSYLLLMPLGLMALGLILQSVVTIIANLKGNKEKENLQIWNFKIVKFISMMTYGPLYKSILQVSMIFGSNFKKKKSMIGLMLSFLLAGMFVAVYQMAKTNIPYLIRQDAYFDNTRVHSSFYESENGDAKFLLAPEIESDKIESKVVKIFIPIYKNERKIREGTCSTYVEDKTKTRDENVKVRRENALECYHKYNVVYLNGTQLSLEYLKYNHEKTDQFGIVGYIDMTNAKFGMNKLTVKKEYVDSENDLEWTIPFYYVLK